MGLFSSIGKVLGKVTKVVTNPLASVLGSTAMDIGSTLYSDNRARQAASTAWDRSFGASNTAYQRATADMRAAGLNPILAYSQGGASTPTAQVASTAPPQTFGSKSIANATALAGLNQTTSNTRLLDAKATEQNLINDGLRTLSPAARALAGSGSGTAAMAVRSADILKEKIRSSSNNISKRFSDPRTPFNRFRSKFK